MDQNTIYSEPESVNDNEVVNFCDNQECLPIVYCANTMHQTTTVDTVYTEYQTHRTTAHQSDHQTSMIVQ